MAWETSKWILYPGYAIIWIENNESIVFRSSTNADRRNLGEETRLACQTHKFLATYTLRTTSLSISRSDPVCHCRLDFLFFYEAIRGNCFLVYCYVILKTFKNCTWRKKKADDFTMEVSQVFGVNTTCFEICC